MSNLNKRADFSAIANWIAPNSQVLDLGCGDGSFLEFLQRQKPVHAYGVEIDDARVLSCVQKGLNVIQQDLEGGLALFEDNSFDTVVLSQTLQTVHQTALGLHRSVGACLALYQKAFADWPVAATVEFFALRALQLLVWLAKRQSSSPNELDPLHFESSQ